MERIQLAEQLVIADETERRSVLAQHTALLDTTLGRTLKALFDDVESSDPERAMSVAAALAAVSRAANVDEVHALAAWVSGMAAQLEGDLEGSLVRLETAEQQFRALGQPLSAAQTQVSKVITLAILGRYDEAIATALAARDVFLAHHDILAAGKIEQNLGGIYHRQDRVDEAERYYRAAQDRFQQLDDKKQLAKVANNLASVLTVQLKFDDAAQLYELGLALAEAEDLAVTQAEIECNMGWLALCQGYYDRALDYLERSRRRYAMLGMPHESAIAKQEIADAYIELNFLPEAAAIYSSVIPVFAQLGMQAEQARALLHHGFASLMLGDADGARLLLRKAQSIYAAEGNSIGGAVATLVEAQALYVEQDYAAAARLAQQAEDVLALGNSRGKLLLARWLRGDCLRALGRYSEARSLLESVRAEAESQATPQIVQRCYTSLGLIATALHDAALAETSFKRAARIIEVLRAPLPAEEIRTAFIADKLAPYTELVRLCLEDGSPDRIREALSYVERARSRALVDMLGGAIEATIQARDDVEADLLHRLQQLRQELHWFYSQLNRLPDEHGSRGSAATADLYDEVREREAAVLELTRQLQHRSGNPLLHAEALDLSQLQEALGDDTILIEYFCLHGEVLAFVIAQDRIDVVRNLADETDVQAALTQVRFQIDALRYGATCLQSRMTQLTQRTKHYLRVLYDLLLKPIADRLDDRRLVIVPHRALHYVPFHALHDGTQYMIEAREVCTSPSATVLKHCLQQPQRAMHHAVLLGVGDVATPKVKDEVAAIAPFFRDAVVLLNDQASLAALQQFAPSADVLHLACHGQFRPDNPLFSSLRLADGWLTVRDAYTLNLRCSLVTLSACETGVHAVAPGDELFGLARGFLGSGTPSLLVTLWTVDDESTATLMTNFYACLRAGRGPAAALRIAQRAMLEDCPHPYFWAPFMLLGRW
jgi:CHAT domain-containing protein/tetratricopeptide (TPR) repeat protein